MPEPSSSDRYELVEHKGNLWDARPMFALDADVTIYWSDVRPCYEEPLSFQERPAVGG